MMTTMKRTRTFFCAQKLTANVYLRQVWTDPRLTWKKEEWNGIDRLRVPASEVKGGNTCGIKGAK